MSWNRTQYKIFLAQGCEESDIVDLLEEYDADIVARNDDHLVVEVDDRFAVAFSDDAEQDYNVACIDEVD